MGYRKINKKAVIDQTAFCKELMERLSDSIEKSANSSSYYYYNGFPGHYRIKQDIIRLRRELQQLSELTASVWEDTDGN